MSCESSLLRLKRFQEVVCTQPRQRAIHEQWKAQISEGTAGSADGLQSEREV